MDKKIAEKGSMHWQIPSAWPMSGTYYAPPVIVGRRSLEFVVSARAQRIAIRHAKKMMVLQFPNLVIRQLFAELTRARRLQACAGI
jgi:hypothetical protein